MEQQIRVEGDDRSPADKAKQVVEECLERIEQLSVSSGQLPNETLCHGRYGGSRPLTGRRRGGVARGRPVAAPRRKEDSHDSRSVTSRTQFLLTPLGSYCDSGRFNVPPGDVSPFGVATFTGCATDNSILTGVTGAASFTMALPDGSCNVGVGFCNPTIGSYKTNIAFDPDQNQFGTTTPVLSTADFTKGTYNCCSSSTVSASSSLFTGTDSGGNTVKIQFTGSAAPGPQTVITVVQNIVSSSS